MPGRIEDYAMVETCRPRPWSALTVLWTGCASPASIRRLASPHCSAKTPTAAGVWPPPRAATARGAVTGGHTLVLETEWETPTGAVRVIDCMPPRGVAPDLVRVVEGVRGRVSVTSELRIRFDYGHVAPWVTIEGREVHAVAGPTRCGCAPLPHTRRLTVRSSPGSHSPRESASLSYSPGRLLTVSVLWLSTACRRWTTRSASGLIGLTASSYDGASKMPCTAPS